MPGEQGLGGDTEGLPPGFPWDQARQEREQRPVRRSIRRACDLTAQDSDLVAKSEQLGILGAIRTEQEYGESDESAEPEIDEGPHPTSETGPSHVPTLSEPIMSCTRKSSSRALSNNRTLRESSEATHAKRGSCRPDLSTV